MDNISKKYIKIIENNSDKNNFIKVTFYYDLGGWNYFTHTEKKRGYYISVSPVERGGGFETYTGFTGVYELLNACNRKSKKAETIATEKMPEYEKILIDHICKKYGYILEY